MSKKLVHTYPVRHFGNAAKVTALAQLYKVYSFEFQKLLHRQYQLHLQGDATALLGVGCSTKGAATPLSQSYYQGCKARACEALSSYVALLHKKAISLLSHSSVRDANPDLYRQAQYLLKCQSRQVRYHKPTLITLQDDYGNVLQVPNIWGKQEPITGEARTLYNQLLRQARKTTAFPSVKAPRLVLDSRTGTLASAKSAGKFDHWLKIATLEKGKPLWLPLVLSRYASQAPGQFANSLELQFKNGELCLSLWKKATPEEYKTWHSSQGKTSQRRRYPTRTVALDFGLCTLLASSEGFSYGHYLYQKLQRFDLRLTELARQRQKLGLKTRSAKYDALTSQIRGFLKTEVGRIVNAFVRERPNLEVVVLEKLRFTAPNLSKRLNRILQNCGLARLRAKFQELAVVYGFAVEEVNPAYTSQTCSHCGWVAKGNRLSQGQFKCLLCGKTCHADYNASCNLLERFQRGEDKLTKQATLVMLKAKFFENLAGNIDNGIISRKRVLSLLDRANLFVRDNADRVQLAVHLKDILGGKAPLPFQTVSFK